MRHSRYNSLSFRVTHALWQEMKLGRAKRSKVKGQRYDTLSVYKVQLLLVWGILGIIASLLGSLMLSEARESKRVKGPKVKESELSVFYPWFHTVYVYVCNVTLWMQWWPVKLTTSQSWRPLCQNSWHSACSWLEYFSNAGPRACWANTFMACAN